MLTCKETTSDDAVKSKYFKKAGKDAKKSE
jgi:hypothetical protein